MKIVVAMCRSHPEPSASNAIYVAALRALGAEVTTPAWNIAPADAFADADAVILRQTWDYQQDAAGFAAWASGLVLAGGTVLNPPHVAIWNNDKRTIAALAKAGFDAPATVDLERGGVEAIPTDRLVIKPAYGGDGYGVTLTDRAGLERALTDARAAFPGRPFLAQEYLAEIAEGEWSLTFIGGAFSHAVLKHAAPGEFRANSRFGAERQSREPPAAAVETAAAILRWLGVDLLAARVDGVMRNGRLVVTELELNDPNLNLDLAPGSAERLAEATLARVQKIQQAA